jgi:hypothetical protein
MRGLCRLIRFFLTLGAGRKAIRLLKHDRRQSETSGGISVSLAAIIVTIFGQLAQVPTTFDLSADFSFCDNPNKVWQFWIFSTNSIAPGQFRLD